MTGVGATQTTQFIFVHLVHIQEEPALPIDNDLKTKGRLQGDEFILYIDPDGAKRSSGGIGEPDLALIDLKNNSNV